MIIFKANSEDPDETPHYVASHLGLCCLTMSHLWDPRLKWVNRKPDCVCVFRMSIRYTLYMEFRCSLYSKGHLREKMMSQQLQLAERVLIRDQSSDHICLSCV